MTSRWYPKKILALFCRNMVHFSFVKLILVLATMVVGVLAFRMPAVPSLDRWNRLTLKALSDSSSAEAITSTRREITLHAKVDGIPYTMSCEAALRALGNPSVKKMHEITPQPFTGSLHGGGVWVTLDNLDEAAKLHNSAHVRLDNQYPIIYSTQCAFDETRVVKLTNFPLKCSKAEAVQFAEGLGNVSRVIVHYQSKQPMSSMMRRRRQSDLMSLCVFVIFNTPQDAKNLYTKPGLSFRGKPIHARPQCLPYTVRSTERRYSVDSDPTHGTTVKLRGFPVTMESEELYSLLRQQGFNITSAEFELGIIHVNGEVHNNKIADVRAALDETASEMVFSQCWAKLGYPNVTCERLFPPNGIIYPMEIPNIPDENVISDKQWYAHFHPYQPSSVLRMRVDTTAATGRRLLFDVTSDWNVSALNNTELNGFKLSIHRRAAVPPEPFYWSARRKVSRLQHIGPFDYAKLPFLFENEVSGTGGAALAEFVSFNTILETTSNEDSENVTTTG